HESGALALPKNVGLAIVVEVADALDLPIDAGVERTDATDELGADAVIAHQPHGGLAAALALPDDIRVAIAVEIADALDLPVGAGIEPPDAAFERRLRRRAHQPQRGLPVVVLPDHVGDAVAVEVASALDVPARERAGRERPDGVEHLRAGVGAIHQPDR